MFNIPSTVKHALSVFVCSVLWIYWKFILGNSYTPRITPSLSIASAAVTPVNGNSANYRCHQSGWKWLCTRKERGKKPSEATKQ